MKREPTAAPLGPVLISRQMVSTPSMYSFFSKELPARDFLLEIQTLLPSIQMTGCGERGGKPADKHCFGHLTLLFDLVTPRECKMNKLGICHKRASVPACLSIVLYKNKAGSFLSLLLGSRKTKASLFIAAEQT